MAGRNQHHFWQLLQRGFGVERKPGYTTVYAYSKDREPYAVGTRNFGAERDFFDFEPGSGADEIITETENDLQGLVLQLQNGEKISEIPSGQLAKLIEHLETRTKFFREHLSGVAFDAIGDLRTWFSKPAIMKKMLKVYLAENPELLDPYLEEVATDPITKAAIRGFFVDNFEELDTSMFEQLLNGENDLLRGLIGDQVSIAKAAHINSVLRKAPDSPRVRRYHGLKYRIGTGFDGRLICPDTMVAFITDTKPTPFLDKSDRLEAVWVPLTPDMMLIGETGARVDRETKTIRRILASTAYKGFIAKNDTAELRSLSTRIGANAEILSENDIKSIKRETLARLLGT